MDNLKTFVLLSRCILEKKIFRNPNWLKVFIWCLIKAGHKERNIAGIPLERGQFIFGRKSASIELNMPESTIYKIINQLQKINSISVKSNNKYSVISIVNYNTYQDVSLYGEQQGNNKVTTKEQQGSTNNNDKHYKKDKNDKNKDSVLFLREKESFEAFWSWYPKKIGRAACFKKWCVIIKNKTDDEVWNILESLKSQTYQKSWAPGKNQFIPYPLTWLNQERWEDVIDDKGMD